MGGCIQEKRSHPYKVRYPTPPLYRERDPTLIQRERSDIYTERCLTRHVYRKRFNPTLIQRDVCPHMYIEKRSHPYTEGEIPHVYRKRDPTRIQKDRSDMYTEGDLTPHLYRARFSYLKSLVKEKTIKHMDWKPCKRNG